MIDKGIRYEVQGGVKNYLGKQKEVKAPVKWKSSPDHPETELAYITKKEKDLLIKSDLHGSLKGSVNRGPSGIISLNGWGDVSGGVSDTSASNAGAEGGQGSGSSGNTGYSAGDGPTARESYMGQQGKTGTPDPNLNNNVDKDGVERDTGLKRARQVNISLANQLQNYTPPPITIPTIGPTSFLTDTFLETPLNALNKFGFEKNKDFFAENVAGKYGYGYGIEDYQDYMSDRMSGKVGAYGNEAQGQNAINQRAGGDNTSGILQALLTPELFDEVVTPSQSMDIQYTPYSNDVVIAPGEARGIRGIVI